ncbi:uncharacterized protein LOC111408295 [Olea europaea var. sylvestris]|uniref:uncharacterized protein LOC111408295 n=1 Tax=Olea europaea var. sylvestris TaxID=158386 RepID=UPI000C1CD11D|nr:uncharacterized protein LOC111408295 [Olea europaea var. sylvestris]
MELAINLKLENIKIYSDSQLVVGQIEGTFNKKDEKMSLYCLKVHDLQRKFKSCEIVKITRAENCKVDALSRLVFMGIDGLDRIVHVRIVIEPSINQIVGVMAIDNEPSWMDPIVDFINHGNLPEDPRAAGSIRSKAPRYCMIEGVLFRRSLTLPYLRCLKPSESSQALEEVHEGICGNHQGARALDFKLIRYGYYWPTMKKDAQDYVKKWDKLKFVAVAVEYFTTWVEAEPLETILEPKLRTFIWRSIICRFGIPKVLITDNGSEVQEVPGLMSYRPYFRRIERPTKPLRGKPPSCWLWVLRPPYLLKSGCPAKEDLSPKMQGTPLNISTTTEHLDLLEEVRDQATLRMASYQDKIAKYFNKKVRMRRFRAADLLLRRAEAANYAPGKLGPVWEGPFEVIRQLQGGAYSLRDISERPLPRPWNA